MNHAANQVAVFKANGVLACVGANRQQHLALHQLPNLVAALRRIHARHGNAQVGGLGHARLHAGQQHRFFLRRDQRPGACIRQRGNQNLARQIVVARELVHLFQLAQNTLQHIHAPLLQHGGGATIGAGQHGVVLLAIAAKHGGGVQHPATGFDIEAVFDQQRIGQQPHHAPVAIAKGVHPAKAVMGQGHLDQIVLGRIAAVDEGHQLLHVAGHLHGVWRQMR